MARLRTWSALAALGFGVACPAIGLADDRGAFGPVSIEGHAFGHVEWSEAPRDWRARLLGDRVARMPGLGWFATRLDPSDGSGARSGLAFDVDPGKQKFILRYRVRY
jgi:hypothetical protein